jgi:signal transduction histidine kinase
LRTAIDSLRNPRDGVGEEEALSGVLSDALREAQIPGTAVALHPAQDCFLPRAAAEQVRRVVLEALGNASRHGHAETIRVELRREDGQALVTVADNGRGMDLGGSDRPQGQHFGLDVMRLRAASIGGHLDVRSAPGRGTEVTLRWPDTG